MHVLALASSPGSYHCGKKVWNAMEVLRVSALYYSTGNAGGVLDFGFSSCAVPNYPLLMSEYFRCIPEVSRLSGSFKSFLGVQKSIQN